MKKDPLPSRSTRRHFTSIKGRKVITIASRKWLHLKTDLALVMYLFTLVDAQAQCDYQYSKTITIDNTLVSGSTDLVDFPLLINLTDTQLATSGANGGNVENANGNQHLYTPLELQHNVLDQINVLNILVPRFVQH